MGQRINGGGYELLASGLDPVSRPAEVPFFACASPWVRSCHTLQHFFFHFCWLGSDETLGYQRVLFLMFGADQYHRPQCPARWCSAETLKSRIRNTVRRSGPLGSLAVGSIIRVKLKERPSKIYVSGSEIGLANERYHLQLNILAHIVIIRQIGTGPSLGLLYMLPCGIWKDPPGKMNV